MDDKPEPPKDKKWPKLSRTAMQALGGSIPFAGGIISAAASYWSEREAEEMAAFIRAWFEMLQEELREKQRTIEDIAARLDMHDEQIQERIKSTEYQSLVRKAFRNWSGSESARKQELVRNILSNAASTRICSDNVVRLFLDWIQSYSEFHFQVIADIYQNPGSTRADMWDRVGEGEPRDDSAEADLFRLLVRDLSTGSVIRQHRDTDSQGQFVKKRPAKAARARTMKSAFDDKEAYELTALGQQFVHYAMTEIPIKLSYTPEPETEYA